MLILHRLIGKSEFREIHMWFRKLKNHLFWFIAKKKGRKTLRKFDALTRNAVKESEKTLKRIMEDNQNSSYGFKHSFEAVDDPKKYGYTVPFSDCQLLPLIEAGVVDRNRCSPWHEGLGIIPSCFCPTAGFMSLFLSAVPRNGH